MIASLRTEKEIVFDEMVLTFIVEIEHMCWKDVEIACIKNRSQYSATVNRDSERLVGDCKT